MKEQDKILRPQTVLYKAYSQPVKKMRLSGKTSASLTHTVRNHGILWCVTLPEETVWNVKIPIGGQFWEPNMSAVEKKLILFNEVTRLCVEVPDGPFHC